MSRMEMLSFRQFHMDGLDFHVITRNKDGDPTHTGRITMEPVTDGSSLPREPTVFLRQNEAQALMDSLYAAGLRPSEARYTNDALNANKEHIADLRKVAFALMERVPLAGKGSPQCPPSPFPSGSPAIK